jgi:hypothetical protein
MLAGWNSTSTDDVSISDYVEPVQNNNKQPDPKKPKKSVEDRMKELRERWKKMSLITKGAWLGVGAGAGYLGADAYKDFTNTQATPI